MSELLRQQQSDYELCLLLSAYLLFLCHGFLGKQDLCVVLSAYLIRSLSARQFPWHETAYRADVDAVVWLSFVYQTPLTLGSLIVEHARRILQPYCHSIRTMRIYGM